MQGLRKRRLLRAHLPVAVVAVLAVFGVADTSLSVAQAAPRRVKVVSNRTRQQRPPVTTATTAPRAATPVTVAPVAVMPDTVAPPAAAPASVPAQLASALPVSADEAAMLQWVNNERVANGLTPFSWNETLAELGRAWSVEMSTTGFRHQSMTPLLNAMGGGVAENISRGTNAALELLHQGLMNSAGHRANILSAKYTRIGIGVHRVGNQVWVTQEFAT